MLAQVGDHSFTRCLSTLSLSTLGAMSSMRKLSKKKFKLERMLAAGKHLDNSGRALGDDLDVDTHERLSD